MSRRKWSHSISVLLFVAGVGMLVFPYVSRFIYQRQVEEMVRSYGTRASDEESVELLYQGIVAYNESLFQQNQSRIVGTSSFEEVDFDFQPFGFTDETFGYIRIPAIDLLLPIYLGASPENLQKGAAHMSQTSLPVGGINTNAVIAGHRNMATKVMFRDIEELEYGDEVMITNFRETLTYKVVETVIITPTEIEKVLIQEGRDLVTLMSCHPRYSTEYRILVYCERVE